MPGTELYHPLSSTEWVHKMPDMEDPSTCAKCCLPPCFLACCGVSSSKPRRHVCCKREAGARGCEERWKCCGFPVEATTAAAAGGNRVPDGCKRRYKCCQQDTGIYAYENVFSIPMQYRCQTYYIKPTE